MSISLKHIHRHRACRMQEQCMGMKLGELWNQRFEGAILYGQNIDIRFDDAV